jgi:hypothetical protein
MSDSGVATEEFLLKNYPDLRSDIVVKGQHHSGISGLDAFLDSVQPQAIVATSRDFPENERIKNEWVERVGGHGISSFVRMKPVRCESGFFAIDGKRRPMLRPKFFGVRAGRSQIR